MERALAGDPPADGGGAEAEALGQAADGALGIGELLGAAQEPQAAPEATSAHGAFAVEGDQGALGGEPRARPRQAEGAGETLLPRGEGGEERAAAGLGRPAADGRGRRPGGGRCPHALDRAVVVGDVAGAAVVHVGEVAVGAEEIAGEEQVAGDGAAPGGAPGRAPAGRAEAAGGQLGLEEAGVGAGGQLDHPADRGGAHGGRGAAGRHLERGEAGERPLGEVDGLDAVGVERDSVQLDQGLAEGGAAQAHAGEGAEAAGAADLGPRRGGEHVFQAVAGAGDLVDDELGGAGGGRGVAWGGDLDDLVGVAGLGVGERGPQQRGGEGARWGEGHGLAAWIAPTASRSRPALPVVG